MNRILIIVIVCLALTSCAIIDGNSNSRDSIPDPISATSIENKAGVFAPEYEIAFTKSTISGDFETFVPQVKFVTNSPTEDVVLLESRINDVFYDASTSWINEEFLQLSRLSVETPIVYCHTERILSIGLFYFLYSTRSSMYNDYITVDMYTGKRLFLKDLIIDLSALEDVLQDCKTVHAEDIFSRETLYNTQEEADLHLRKSLNEMSRSSLDEMLNQCSLEQSEFPIKDSYKSTLPSLFMRPNFYLRGSQLVIELTDQWHNIVILNLEDIENILSPILKCQ